MSEKLEETVSETVTPVSAPARIEPADLPPSARKIMAKAKAMGWLASAWLTVAEFPSSLYASNSEDKGYNVGDVKTEGYLANVYTVEARDALIPLGFRADWLQKQYSDGRKTSAGAFSAAFVVDPVGSPRELKAVYKAATVSRGKYETEKSFKLRADTATATAINQAKTYNDGARADVHQFTMKAREFESWLSEWADFCAPKGLPNV